MTRNRHARDGVTGSLMGAFDFNQRRALDAPDAAGALGLRALRLPCFSLT